MEFLTFIGHSDYVGDGVGDGFKMVNHRVDNRVDPCWNQCCKTSNHGRSVNKKSAIKSATI